jgi:hypothetical protein
LFPIVIDHCGALAALTAFEAARQGILWSIVTEALFEFDIKPVGSFTWTE